jgi:ornithine cyclodeaminase/alanine dehydrogenase-like protein (mu-crystallin family)
MEASAMTEVVLRLDADEVCRVLEVLDPVAVLAEELIKSAINHPDLDSERASRLVPWPDGDGDHLRVDTASPGVSCAMPATALRMAHAAALAAIATRELLPPGGITVAILGTRKAIQSQLSVLVRHVPDIVHVAVRVTDDDDTGVFEPRLLDQLDFAGISLSVVAALGDSLFGANLVVAVSEEALTESGEQATVNQLVRGTVLVNASGHDLPAGLVNHADQIYVDDLALLPVHPDRYVVARHLEHAAAEDAWPGGHGGRPAISSDLGLLLAGARPSRVRQADILVVELLSVNAPNTHLAHLIAESAVRAGLGERVAASTREGE